MGEAATDSRLSEVSFFSLFFHAWNGSVNEQGLATGDEIASDYPRVCNDRHVKPTSATNSLQNNLFVRNKYSEPPLV